jgi:hypothetical protein
MNPSGRRDRRRGLLLGLLQAALLLSLGGQLLLDRATRPRGWVLTEPVDPNLPIRGRYVDLALVVPAPAGAAGRGVARPGDRVVLRSEGGRVLAELANPATPSARSLKAHPRLAWEPPGAPRKHNDPWRLEPSVAFFIPPRVADPSRRPAGEQLWVEVTLPAQGPPRPIRLGVKREGGAITPLELR